MKVIHTDFRALWGGDTLITGAIHPWSNAHLVEIVILYPLKDRLKVPRE